MRISEKKLSHLEVFFEDWELLFPEKDPNLLFLLIFRADYNVVDVI